MLGLAWFLGSCLARAVSCNSRTQRNTTRPKPRRLHASGTERKLCGSSAMHSESFPCSSFLQLAGHNDVLVDDGAERTMLFSLLSTQRIPAAGAGPTARDCISRGIIGPVQIPKGSKVPV